MARQIAPNINRFVAPGYGLVHRQGAQRCADRPFWKHVLEMRPFHIGKADFQNVLAAGFHGRRIFEGRSRKGQPFLASVVGHFVATRLCSPYIDHEDDYDNNDDDAGKPGCELAQKFRAVVFLFQLGLGCDQRGKGCVALAFIKTDAFVQSDTTAQRSGAVLQPAGDSGAVDQGREECGQMDTAFVSRFCGQPSAAATLRAGLQLGQLSAAVGAAPLSAPLDVDDAAGEADQNWGEGGAAFPTGGLPDGGGVGAESTVPNHS